MISRTYVHKISADKTTISYWNSESIPLANANGRTKDKDKHPLWEKGHLHPQILGK